MNRREAIAKATTTRAVVGDGLLDPAQSRAFIRKIKESDPFGQAIRQEVVNAPSGEINKLATSSRIIRAAAENADDGYRAEPTFPTVPYATVKIRLPWEVTEDAYHENIEGEALEAKLVDEMTQQFGLDLSDLDINGDTADASGDAAFLNIDNGLLKYLATNASGNVHRVNGGAINSGNLSKAHIFAAVQALPNRYRNQGNAKLFMSPARAIDWIEYLTDRATGAGDAALVGGGAAGNTPLGLDIVQVPQFPDSRIVFSNPKNFVRVISWQVRKRKVTGATDWELATRDKRGYIFFMKRDFIVEEDEAVVDLYGLSAI